MHDECDAMPTRRTCPVCAIDLDLESVWEASLNSARIDLGTKAVPMYLGFQRTSFCGQPSCLDVIVTERDKTKRAVFAALHIGGSNDGQ